MEEIDGASIFAPDHYCLGMTLEAHIEALQKIGILDTAETDDLSFEAGYYQRSTSLSWVTEAYGEELTTYDSVKAAKGYLEAADTPGLSICELMHQQGDPRVGKSDVFFSHIQGFPVVRMLLSLQDAINMYPQLSETSKLWIDCNCLRQAVPAGDFDLDQVRSAIHDTPILLIELDDGRIPPHANGPAGALDPAYLSRKFCIFEAWAASEDAARENGVQLVVCGPAVQDTEHAPWLAATYVDHGATLLDSKSAECRSSHHALAIDRYIANTIGHLALDERVSAAIAAGVTNGLQFVSQRHPAHANAAAAVGVDPAALHDDQLHSWCTGHASPEVVTALSMERCAGISSSGLQSVQIFQSLQRLSLCMCTSVAHITPLAHLPFLRDLDLSSTTVADLAPLAGMHHLHTLSLFMCEQVHDLEPLRSCLQLHHLQLEGCTRLQKHTLAHLGGLVQLRRLGLAGIANDSEWVAMVGTHCPGIEELDLRYCTAEDISALGKCAQLQRLDIECCEEVRDLSGLCSCARLVHLNLILTKVEEGQQAALMMALPGLEIVDGSGGGGSPPESDDEDDG
jgi:hypothetical protein